MRDVLFRISVKLCHIPGYHHWSASDFCHKNNTTELGVILLVSQTDMFNKKSNCRWFESPWRSCDVAVTKFWTMLVNRSYTQHSTLYQWLVLHGSICMRLYIKTMPTTENRQAFYLFIHYWLLKYILYTFMSLYQLMFVVNNIYAFLWCDCLLPQFYSILFV